MLIRGFVYRGEVFMLNPNTFFHVPKPPASLSLVLFRWDFVGIVLPNSG